VDSQIDFAAYNLSLHLMLPDMVDLTRATPDQQKQFYQLIEAYVANHNVDFSKYPVFADVALREKCKSIQIKSIEQKLDVISDKEEVYSLLAELYKEQRMVHKTVAYYRKILQLNPNSVLYLNNLAWRLSVHKDADFHNPQEAIQLAEKACNLTSYKTPNVMDTLSVAYAAAGNFVQAKAIATDALAMAQHLEDKSLVMELQNHLTLYSDHQPYVEPMP
jgi:tetratricopeptide (TPR) repeat protein